MSFDSASTRSLIEAKAAAVQVDHQAQRREAKQFDTRLQNMRVFEPAYACYESYYALQVSLSVCVCVNMCVRVLGYLWKHMCMVESFFGKLTWQFLGERRHCY